MATNDLRKSLGPLTLIALGAAGVIGTSWIYTNGIFFSDYGAGGMIFGLALGAILAGLVALSYAELAAKFPRAGGEVVYGYLGFNRRVAFIVGWLLIGAYVSSLAFYVTASGFLLADLFPFLTTIPLYTIADTTVYLPVLAVGVLLAASVCGINAYGMRLGGNTQLLLFGVILFIGAILAVVGFSSGSPSNFWPPYAQDGSPVPQTLRFVLPAMTFLTGFSLVAILAEDANLRPRNIGRVVVATIVVAGTFYCLVLLASAWVIPWQRTAQLEQGTIDAYRIAGFPALGWGAYAISVLGLVTSFLALFVATSRIMVALARAGLFPAMFATINERRGTPVNALIFTLSLALGLGWLGQGAITWFLDTGGVYIGLAWFMAVLCMYRVRRRYPDVDSPYHVRLSWLPLIGGVAAVLIIVFTLIPGTGMSLIWPQEYAILAVWVLLGTGIYALAPKEGRDRQAVRTLMGDEYHKVEGSRRVR
ncbi:APC family permease [Rubrobacter aplysinae]|uniref:APC family permease n=1 Tax=Rubrobacter aplysinae TaxID=909625 RepID=UPI000AABB535|nr:APC family permease [Rubrobacter aplysinae]